MSSGSKKGTQIYLFFSLKSSSKRTHSRFSNRAHMEGDTCLQGNLHTSQNLIKILLGKKALRKKHPSMFPKSGAPMEADAHFWALLNISFGVPCKGAPPSWSTSWNPLQRDTPFLEPSFIHLSKSLVYEPPSRFQVLLSCEGAPMERDAAFSAYPAGSPAREPFLQVPFTEFPQRVTLHLQSLFQPYLIPGRWTHSRLPNWAPMERDACPQSLPFITLRASRKGAPPFRCP